MYRVIEFALDKTNPFYVQRSSNAPFWSRTKEEYTPGWETLSRHETKDAAIAALKIVSSPAPDIVSVVYEA